MIFRADHAYLIPLQWSTTFSSVRPHEPAVKARYFEAECWDDISGARREAAQLLRDCVETCRDWWLQGQSRGTGFRSSHCEQSTCVWFWRMPR